MLPLKVFITTDVEILRSQVLKYGFEKAFINCIHGGKENKGVGIGFQLKMLNRLGLKGCFFVESLFADIYGIGALREIVQKIKYYQQEVQLHIHTEWLSDYDLIPGKSRQNIHQYNEKEQKLLINKSKENLLKAGSDTVIGFRAGNYGANLTTLIALRKCGFKIDTSYNYTYLGKTCSIITNRNINKPFILRGITELPITYFKDGFNKVRHAQICAVSSREMFRLLEQAYNNKWECFVIVSHSFELMNRTNWKPSQILKRRFENLCKFLSENKDRFITCWLSEIELKENKDKNIFVPIFSNPQMTIVRYFEQALSKLI